jgi:hypothetical protein
MCTDIKTSALLDNKTLNTTDENDVLTLLLMIQCVAKNWLPSVATILRSPSFLAAEHVLLDTNVHIFHRTCL